MNKEKELEEQFKKDLEKIHARCTCPDIELLTYLEYQRERRKCMAYLIKQKNRIREFTEELNLRHEMIKELKEHYNTLHKSLMEKYGYGV